jgi:phosphoribosylglycinamide formyltransferase 1
MSVVVLISGRGSNMQALLEAGVPVSAVLSNRGDAAGLELARLRGVPTRVVEHRGYRTREQFEAALAEAIEGYGPRLVALAGFMRVLTAGFVERYAGRLLNIHPSLLPAFPGVNAQQQAFEYGVKFSGCTVHFVDGGVDSGPVIAQAVVPVRHDDDASALRLRILHEEHRLLPAVVRAQAEGRIVREGRRVHVHGAPTSGPVDPGVLRSI